jgi:ATP-dependent phosphoenolpyruvate carboxykinase
MRRTEGPSFTIGPDMIGIERITQNKEYRFIRLEDRFGFEEILPHVPRQHKNLARNTGLFDGRTPDGKYIVTDGGRMIAFADHVELAPD